MNDLIKLMDPRYIEYGEITPRGGISIDPYCNYGRPGTKYEQMADYRMMNHDLYPETIDNVYNRKKGSVCYTDPFFYILCILINDSIVL